MAEQQQKKPSSEEPKADKPRESGGGKLKLNFKKLAAKALGGSNKEQRSNEPQPMKCEPEHQALYDGHRKHHKTVAELIKAAEAVLQPDSKMRETDEFVSEKEPYYDMYVAVHNAADESMREPKTMNETLKLIEGAYKQLQLADENRELMRLSRVKEDAAKGKAKVSLNDAKKAYDEQRKKVTDLMEQLPNKKADHLKVLSKLLSVLKQWHIDALAIINTTVDKCNKVAKDAGENVDIDKGDKVK